MVVDFRAFNLKIRQDKFPLPNIVEILYQLGKAKYVLIFDLASGFNQIGLKTQTNKEKTAFSTPTGHYHYL